MEQNTLITKVIQPKLTMTKTSSLPSGKIKCKHCHEEATIITTDFRYKVYCVTCGSEYYLKEQHL
jgi:ribosomal protein S27E